MANKEKLECILNIAKNIPFAALETLLATAALGGTAAATIGAGTAYLIGHHETAWDIFKYGFLTGSFGYTFGTLYLMINVKGAGEFGTLEPDNLGIENILEEIERYKKISDSHTYKE